MDPPSAGRSAARRPASGAPRRRRAGFTLLELMVVVIVIMIVAAIALPAIGGALAQRRASHAALDVVRIARQARAAAAGNGWAYLLRYTSDTPSGSGVGALYVYRGQNNGCNTTDWGSVIGAGCSGNDDCRESLLMSSHPYFLSGEPAVQMHMVSPDGSGGTVVAGDSIDICYEPSGVMQWRQPAGAGRFSDRNITAAGDELQGGVLFRLRPADGGERKGVDRLAVLPLGGDPRVVR